MTCRSYALTAAILNAALIVAPTLTLAAPAGKTAKAADRLPGVADPILSSAKRTRNKTPLVPETATWDGFHDQLNARKYLPLTQKRQGRLTAPGPSIWNDPKMPFSPRAGADASGFP